MFTFARQLSGRFLKISPRRLLKFGLISVGGVAFAYNVSDRNTYFFGKYENSGSHFPLMVQCSKKFNIQSSVVNDTKNHALYLTIHLTSGAHRQECMKVLGQLDKHIESICPAELRDEENELWYGVGFGPQLLEAVKGDLKQAGIAPFTYRPRNGKLGAMPSTGGDIFVHAKCNERGKLFELTQAIINSLPKGSVAKFEDIYGWVYRNGRDLSGFIDGTANPADSDERYDVAVDPKTGGSYVITQKWIHKHDVIQNTKDTLKSQWVGRELSDSTELKKKSITSHVARMVGSVDLEAPAKFQVVRHSQPWGTVSGDSGLFFIAYSAKPEAFDYMLDRMTDGEDGRSDDVMRMTSVVTGAYWYFPSADELKRMTSGGVGGWFR